ncbi:TetR/AcrR family transcriptional regulator [Mycobacteroides franklinii]|uniref:TetR/AcrR family transcriptional regulator n=1 Tax=Mycobacteroides franklinii TaxID=948102 RepID=UPI001F2798A7|nr:TetR/AcrR family transcriptional regulator [Mycobacteroides franklinii]
MSEPERRVGGPRTWAGDTPDERRAARREALLMAGIALLGHPNGPSVTTRAVCRESKLTQRYFYESFQDYDSFVEASYRRAWEIVRSSAVRNVAELTDKKQIIKAAVRSWTKVIANQPDVVRTILQAPDTESVLKEPALRQRADAELLALRVLDDVEDPLARTMIVRSVWGSLRTLFMSYMNDEMDCSLLDFESRCETILVRLLIPSECGNDGSGPRGRL